jgi:signal transduction histidine kinase/CheY-like chemotaxis protein/HPt (histidine-containing phosphotransfer) domain-containing protein
VISSARSIRTKLALLIVLSVGAAALSSFGLGTYRELVRFAEAKRAEWSATADVLAASVAEPLSRGDRATAQQVLNSIGRMPTIRFAEIRNPAGAPFAQAGTGVALVSADTVPGGVGFWDMLTRGAFFLSADIVKGGRQVGRLGLLVDTAELWQRVAQALTAASLSAGLAVVIGLVIAGRLQRAITRPLAALTSTMSRVRASNDFSERAERSSDDETGQLVDAFNDMLDQIGRRDAALEAHRAGLERTVEERTRDLAEARDVAEAANRAKSDFLATMSHEIRTPMNGVLVMAELLAGAGLPPRQQRYAETIARSGQTLIAIINDILDLSKIEAGKLTLEQGRAPLATLVEDVLSLFWERAAAKSLDLAARLGPDVPAAIEADPVRLGQILANLVNNALKFTESGHVMLSVSLQAAAGPDRAELRFAVSDTGIGIPADKLGGIFEAFTQADQSTTRRYGGTGLGLSISRRLVDAMGGRMEVESNEGHGSVFSFTLPARILEPAPSQAVATSGRRAAVLVAGDATRQVLREALADSGYALVDGEGGRPDAIFAEPDWIAANEAVLAVPGVRPPVICVAGFGDPRVDRLQAAGLADAVLVQPVSSPRLREVLRALAAGTLAALDHAGRNVQPDMPSLPRLRLLVADDSPVNREVVSEALARLGAETVLVEDGLQAVEAFRAGRFDAVLMDCSMPHLDGFGATRAIRAFEAETGASRTPVVALTAHVAGGGADNWREAGMDAYLSKPFTMRSLADCLKRLQPTAAQAVPAPLPAAADAPAPPSEEREGPLDPAVLDSLKAIAGGSPAMLERIFGLFRAHAPARFAGLTEACAAGDLERIASEAHALKSPSLNIGALRLGRLCGELETEARAGRPDDQPERLKAIEAELADVMQAIGAPAPVPATLPPLALAESV